MQLKQLQIERGGSIVAHNEHASLAEHLDACISINGGGVGNVVDTLKSGLKIRQLDAAGGVPLALLRIGRCIRSCTHADKIDRTTNERLKRILLEQSLCLRP